MFTGIIEEVGILKAINKNELAIQCKKIIGDSKIGDSISVNGTCLTITGIHGNLIKFHASPTTQDSTRFKMGKMHIGEEVNLERALLLSTRLGGHIVTGHVDCISKIIAIDKQENDTNFEFLYPKDLKNLIVKKGSIAIDGISLTISDVRTSSFVVTIIPHTINSTNLKQKRIGDYVHLEADMFARYIYNILLNGGINGTYKEIIERFCIR